MNEKLELVDWLCDMLYRSVPADELCLIACRLYLNIHIMVDFHHGYWSTLNLHEISHDLITALSDVHLVYRGFCKYNYLCQKVELRTKGCKILNYKLKNNKRVAFKKLRIHLKKVEEWNDLAKQLLNKDSKLSNAVTTVSAKNNTKVALKKLRIHLKNVEEWNDLAKQLLNKDSKLSNAVTTVSAEQIERGSHMTNGIIEMVKIQHIKQIQRKDDVNNVDQEAKGLKIHVCNLVQTIQEPAQVQVSDTDSTISYELQENVIGTIYFLDNDHLQPTPQTVKKLKTRQKDKLKNSQRSYEQTTKTMHFKCESSKCKVHTSKCRDINTHFRTVHKKKLKCNECKKSYDTPYSLKQH